MRGDYRYVICSRYCLSGCREPHYGVRDLELEYVAWLGAGRRGVRSALQAADLLNTGVRVPDYYSWKMDGVSP